MWSQGLCVGGRRVSPWRWEGSLFWGWRPGMALWGKGPPQLCTTCLIAHLTFAELNQGCLVWADCTRPTGQAGGLPEVQAAQAGLLKGSLGGGGTGVELLLLSAQLGVGTGRHWRWCGGGEVPAGVRARCHRVEGYVGHRAVCMFAGGDSSLT